MEDQNPKATVFCLICTVASKEIPKILAEIIFPEPNPPEITLFEGIILPFDHIACTLLHADVLLEWGNHRYFIAKLDTCIHRKR